MRFVLGLMLGFFSTVSMAFETVETGTFFSGGRAVTFSYNPHIAATPRSPDKSAKTDAFSAMGIEIVDAGSSRTKIGLPVKFTDSGTVGVMTSRVLVRTASTRDLYAAVSSAKNIVSIEKKLFGDGIFSITFSDPVAAAAGAKAIYGNPGIVYAHPNFFLPVETRGNPDHEPLFSSQWNLENNGQTGGTPGSDIKIRSAWQHTFGSPETLVAVIDLGFEQSHSDLADAWFINTREIPGNRIDDDGNGLKDDVSGWNYAINGPNLVYGQNAAHGTSTSGIIGARANGQGTTGICPQCKILPIVIDAEVANAVAAFYYARSFGAKVISNSWGYKIGTPRMDAVVDAINQTANNGRNGKGISIVFAMSNFGRNDCRGPEPDISSLDSVIAVSSVDHNDVKVEASAYGPCMEFVAPTSGSTVNAVATTDRPGEKGYNRGENPDDFSDLDYTHTFYGTSAATPQVAGTLALIYSIRPDLSAGQAFEILKVSADKVHPDLAAYGTNGHSQIYGYGRINAGKALETAKNF